MSSNAAERLGEVGLRSKEVGLTWMRDNTVLEVGHLRTNSWIGRMKLTR